MGEPIWPFNEQESLHFDYEWMIYTSSEIYEESDYGLDMDLLTISYKIRVSFPRIQGVGKCDHLWPIYLTTYILSPVSHNSIFTSSFQI
jgi:hypothetical protein